MGQATLYRHFPERWLLALAVYEQRLQHFDELANLHAGDPRVFLQLIEWLILEETRTPGLLRVLRGAAQGERYLRDLRKRMLQLLPDPLEAAKAAGLVRANVQLDDVPRVIDWGYSAQSSSAESRSCAANVANRRSGPPLAQCRQLRKDGPASSAVP